MYDEVEGQQNDATDFDPMPDLLVKSLQSTSQDSSIIVEMMIPMYREAPEELQEMSFQSIDRIQDQIRGVYIYLDGQLNVKGQPFPNETLEAVCKHFEIDLNSQFHDEQNQQNECVVLENPKFSPPVTVFVKKSNKGKFNSEMMFLNMLKKKYPCESLWPNVLACQIDADVALSKGTLQAVTDRMYQEPSLAVCGAQKYIHNLDDWNFIHWPLRLDYLSLSGFSIGFRNEVRDYARTHVVVPGNFCAYRLSDTAEIQADLEKEPQNIFEANARLTEDAEKPCKMLLHKKPIVRPMHIRVQYNVPEYLPELMEQRRRWINGGWTNFLLLVSEGGPLDFTFQSMLGLMVWFETFFMGVISTFLGIEQAIVIFGIAQNYLWFQHQGFYGCLILEVMFWIIYCVSCVYFYDRRRAELHAPICYAYFITTGVFFFTGGIATLVYNHWSRTVTIITYTSWIIYAIIQIVSCRINHKDGLCDFLKASPFAPFLITMRSFLFYPFAFANYHRMNWGTREKESDHESELDGHTVTKILVSIHASCVLLNILISQLYTSSLLYWVTGNAIVEILFFVIGAILIYIVGHNKLEHVSTKAETFVI